MPTKDIEKREEAQVPDLAPTPAADQTMDSNDIALPKLYKGEPQSDAVGSGRVPKGCIFTAAGPDDPDPEVHWEYSDTPEPGDGVLVHILSWRKGWSYSEPGGELETWQFDDPSRHPDAWVTHQYVVAVPEIDPDIPVKLLMTKTSTPTAKRINTLLARGQAAGKQYHEQAFRLTTKHREAKKGSQTFRWYIWQARGVEAEPKNVEVASALVDMARSARGDIERTAPAGNEPQI